MFIFVLFYLYLPQQNDRLMVMDKTLGEGDLDVLCVGSSHMHFGINPIQLFNEEGYAAYDLAEGAQAPWQTLCYIKNACVRHKPKLIILDVYMIGNNQDVESGYKDYQTVINLLGMRFNLSKVEALLESTADSKLNVMLIFPYTYDDVDDYTGLSFHKWIGEPDYSFGYHCATTVYPHKDALDLKSITEVSPIHSKNEKYLRKIIDYCQDNDIEIVLTNTPYPEATVEGEKCFNYIDEIATEYGIPFINGWLLYKDMGIDYMTDCCDEGGHLNYNGVSKYTKWIQEYLKQNYDLPDHRGDPRYSAYLQGVDWLEETVKDKK